MSPDSKLQAWSPSALSSPLQPSVKVRDSPMLLAESFVSNTHTQLPSASSSALPLLLLRKHQLTSFPLPADLVQDLYLKELKAYKAPAIKANDSEGHVQKFSPPAAPKSPEETDIANELKAYEASTVDVEGQTEGGVEEPEHDWFEEAFAEEEDEAKH